MVDKNSKAYKPITTAITGKAFNKLRVKVFKMSYSELSKLMGCHYNTVARMCRGGTIDLPTTRHIMLLKARVECGDIDKGTLTKDDVKLAAKIKRSIAKKKKGTA
jgi:hypothetical protein